MITVFTPTYNRAQTLERLFTSLCKQTNNSFEWLVVDDGSSDNTEAVISEFIKSARFPIHYVKQKNGGKHRAYNMALKEAKGECFVCVDSDDWLDSSAIENIASWMQLRQDNVILSYKKDQNGKRLSNEFPNDKVRVSLIDLQEKYHCFGEFTIILRTAFARQYPFPCFDGEHFVTESVIYDRMAVVEKVALFPKVITICEYQENGLTQNINRIMKNNPAGYCLYFMQRIDMQKNLIRRIIMAGKYQCFCLFAKEKKTRYKGNNTLCVFLSTPLGVLFWLYYRTFRHF